MTNHDDATPIRQQYLDIKKEHPNTILFFRLGDFYETFDEDAEIQALLRELAVDDPELDRLVDEADRLERTVRAEVEFELRR